MTKRDGFWVLVTTPFLVTPIAGWLLMWVFGGVGFARDAGLFGMIGGASMFMAPILALALALTPLGIALWKQGREVKPNG